MFICKFCARNEFKKPGSHAMHERSCHSNPNRVANCNNWSNPDYKISESTRKKMSASSKGRIHSEETKKKISKSRKQFLTENPDKVPYLMNHYSKGDSYPEKYFEEAFKSEGINLIKKYRIGLYELDFCCPEKKVDIEIDGDQHYLDTRIVASDIKRNEYLKNLGWKVYRIKWSEYQTKTFEQKHNIILEIKNLLGS
jgi:very-short-patch-repair endonuclease